MRHYELMVILDPELEERTVAPSPGHVPQRHPQRRWHRREGRGVGHVAAWPTRSRRSPRASTRCSTSTCEPGRGRRARPSAGAERVGAAHQGHAPRAEAAPAAAGRELSVAMAGETVITVVGNLTADPELRFTPSGGRGRQLHRRVDPAHLRPPDRRVEGRRRPVHPLQRLAAVRRERRRDADQGHAGDRDRAAQAASVRDPRGREAHRRRARGRRGRPGAAVRHGQGQPGQPQPDGGFGGGGRRLRRWLRR